MTAYIWIIMGALCLLIEFFTGDLLFATIGISALIASILAFIGAGIVSQIIVFILSAIIIFLSIKSCAKKSI